MKKVLLTTTALTLLATAAVAEVKLSGSARINVLNNGNNTGASTTVLENRARVNVKLSGGSDGGLTFGASTRLQTAGGGARGVQGAAVWVSNGTITLTQGNTSGAVGNTAGIYAVGGCGFSASAQYGSYCANVLDVFQGPFAGSSSGGAGNNMTRVDFALGGLNVSVSGGTGLTQEIAANYDMGAFNIALGSVTKATPVAAVAAVAGTPATLASTRTGDSATK